MTLQSNIPDALKRKIGPLPAWGWGLAIGGGLLGWQMLRSDGETEGTYAEDDDADYDFGQDVVSAGGIGNYGGYDGFGGAGTTAPAATTETSTSTTTTDFRCPKGYKKATKASGRVYCKPVKKGSGKKGFWQQWSYKTESWVYKPVKKKTKSFTVDEPHIKANAMPNNTAPTVSSKNVAAIAIASPDRTPKREVTPVNLAKSAETPVLPNVPPRPTFRQDGRPFHKDK